MSREHRRLTVSLGLLCALLAAAGRCANGSDPIRPRPSIEYCSGQVGLCSHGQPASVTDQMRQAWHAVLGQAIESCYGEIDPCAIPGATCLNPAPAIVQLVGHAAAADELAPRSKTILELLRDWSAASRSRQMISDRDLAWMQRMNAPGLSAHIVIAAAKLLGPVELADLQQEYLWTVEQQGESGAWLSAVPNDETIRLFCPKLKIELTRFSEVTAITACDRNGESKTVSLPVPAEQPLLVEVDYGSLPPSPRPVPTATPLIRFAAGTIEVEIEVE